MTKPNSEKLPQWVEDFKNDTAKWHKSLLDTDQCLVCGIRPDLILQVSQLIPAELLQEREKGREEQKNTPLTNEEYEHLINTIWKDEEVKIRQQTARDIIDEIEKAFEKYDLTNLVRELKDKYGI